MRAGITYCIIKSKANIVQISSAIIKTSMYFTRLEREEYYKIYRPYSLKKAAYVINSHFSVCFMASWNTCTQYTLGNFSYIYIAEMFMAVDLQI